MKQYLELLKTVLSEGIEKSDRTGTGTKSIFGYQMRFNLQDGFPLLTTKKMFLKGIIGELLWFLSGSTNANDLKKQGIHIWDAWAKEDGELGPIYSAQWRTWPKFKIEGLDYYAQKGVNIKTSYPVSISWIDQIAEVIESIKTNPNSRRHIVSAWNVSELDNMALPPCHSFFQFYVRGEYLDLQLYQRSGDVFLGVPFNIASYSLLLMMVAQVTNYKPGNFIHTIGDAHIYLNHMDQVKEQLKREPMKLPEMKLNPDILKIDDFKMEDFTLLNYNSHPTIKAPIAV